jgi:hypothetical protein
MSKVYRNSYSAPKVVIDDYHPETPEDEYDHNYVFDVKALRSDRVELRPFIASPLFVMQFQMVTNSVAITTLGVVAARSPGRS